MAKGKTKSRTAENLKPAAVLEISWIDRKKLVPNQENPRDNRNAVEAVAASIQRFGWRSPLVARRGTLMLEAGHTRLAAAELLEDLVQLALVDLARMAAQPYCSVVAAIDVGHSRYLCGDCGAVVGLACPCRSLQRHTGL